VLACHFLAGHWKAGKQESREANEVIGFY
jgi:hypothetical protein